MSDAVLNLIRAMRERLHLTLPQTISLFLGINFVVSLVCVALFSAIAEDVTQAEQIVIFDQWLADALHNRATTGWTTAFAILTLFGAQVVFGLSLVVAAYYLLKRQWLYLAVWAAALAGGELLNRSLKQYFSRPRPTFDEPLVVEAFYSFPSGHAMLSTICYGLLAYFVLERIRDRRLKAIVIALTVVFIAMIGFSRLYLGVHFFSDVIAGYLAGGAWLFACISALSYVRQRRALREQAAAPGR